MVPHASYHGHSAYGPSWETGDERCIDEAQERLRTKMRQAVRSEVGLPADALVLMNFGRIRHYKGHARLFREFAAACADDCTAGGRPLHLWVIGENQGKIDLHGEATKAGVPAGSYTVTEVLLFDAALGNVFAAADIAVFAHDPTALSVLNSGSVMAALSFGVPVIAPRLGCIGALICPSGIQCGNVEDFAAFYEPSNSTAIGALSSTIAAKASALSTPASRAAARFAARSYGAREMAAMFVGGVAGRVAMPPP